jgi:hypothetical protein
VVVARRGLAESRRARAASNVAKSGPEEIRR